MGRVLKGRKAKANSNFGEDGEKDVEQDNGSVLPSDEESGSDKKTTGKRNKRVKKSGVSKKTGKKPRKSRENGEGSDVEPDEDSDDSAPLSKKAHISRKATDKKVNNANENDENEDDEEDYEVEKIVDFKIKNGEKKYRVRWRGYGEDKDTWESEGNLNCRELIEEFLSENPDALNTSSKSKSKKKEGEKKGKKQKSSSLSKAKRQPVVEPVSEEDGQKVYEVDKIIEVHFKKNGGREFLIRWKGFSSDDDTWEPESHLNCPDLIEKFMQKVDKAREVSVRELRVDPQVTKRFTLNTRESGRRLSGRHQSKQRATYYSTE